MYSESGDTITLFANTTLGGNAKVCHFELSTKAVANVVLRVVIATGGMGYPIMLVGASAWAIMPLIFASNCADIR